MWDSNAPLQLLKSMSKKLSKENLEKIQLVIDADKYKNSLISGFDLCGMYAPFCRGCKKTSIYPCAIAYINMKKAEGMDIEIDAKPVTGDQSKAFDSKSLTEEQPISEVKPEVNAVEEIAVTTTFSEEETVEEIAEEHSAAREITEVKEEAVEEAQPVEEVQPSDEKPKKTVKHKIRIAVARKKI